VERWESPVEKAIREAQERGEFDNLPGAGKPLANLGPPEYDDPDWWVKGFVEREGLDLAGALSPAMALRKEAAGFPESLLDLHTEDGVRLVLEDYNRRVKLDRLRPGTGPRPPVWARLVDVDELVGQWRQLRAAAAVSVDPAPKGEATPTPAELAGPPRRGRPRGLRALVGWWRRAPLP
jgi:hypothetical protein